MTLPRRTPLRRRSPLRAKTRIGPKRITARRTSATRNPAYLAFVRSLPCSVPDGSCRGRIEAHHAGPRGLGQRASDDTAIPLCLVHHRQWHDAGGLFQGWPRLTRVRWSESVIADTRGRWAARV